MIKIIILTIILPTAISICYSLCQRCQDSNLNPSPYACLSCLPENAVPYLSSCPSDSNTSGFLAPALIITFLHLFMLAVGMGVYRQIYQQIQLASLMTWRYNFQKGTISFQVTNFAFLHSNTFTSTYGIQFIFLLLALTTFLVVLAATDKKVHSPAATLLRRKKIIFPVRLVTLTFNALLLSSLMQLTADDSVISYQIFPFALAATALTVVFVFLVGVGVISNWKKFQVQDPHYYVLLQQMTSKRWYAKNSLLISLLYRATVICVYVGSFSRPGVAGIIIVILQTGYTVYFVALLRFTKIRYLLILTLSNFLMIAVMAVSFSGGNSDLGSSSWDISSLAYVVLMMALVMLFFGACCMEIVFMRERVVKQLKSFYGRFIKCEKLQEKVEVTKYDEHSHRERVVEFHRNLLYQRDLQQDRTVTIEMQTPSKF